MEPIFVHHLTGNTILHHLKSPEWVAKRVRHTEFNVEWKCLNRLATLLNVVQQSWTPLDDVESVCLGRLTDTVIPG